MHSLQLSIILSFTLDRFKTFLFHNIVPFDLIIFPSFDAFSDHWTFWWIYRIISHHVVSTVTSHLLIHQRLGLLWLNFYSVWSREISFNDKLLKELSISTSMALNNHFISPGIFFRSSSLLTVPRIPRYRPMHSLSRQYCLHSRFDSLGSIGFIA